MFYTIYKITNKLNGKIYIGCHKTKKLDDGYMGSGTYLRRAQEKYGIENFEKEILEVFDNSDQMFEMESLLVNPDFVKREDTYNLKEGGYGGFNIEWCRKGRQMANENGALEKAQASLKLLRNDPEWQSLLSDKRVSTMFERYGIDAFVTFKGKKHSDETKEKMRDKHKENEHQIGEKNSQFGTMWIHNLTEKLNKKIKKEDFLEFESQGWQKGRKIKM